MPLLAGHVGIFRGRRAGIEAPEQVRYALQRLEEGTYGKCAVCGRQIERARLEAVPWTPYCLEDQEKQDCKQAHN